MKAIFSAFLLFSFLGLKAQENTSVQKPAGSEVVDSVFVGNILIDKENTTRIYLTGFKQTLDSTGIYSTIYTFGSKIPRPTFDVNIKMKFHSPIIFDGPIGFKYGPLGAGRYSGSGALRNDNTFLYLQGQVTAETRHFYIEIKSKQKVHPLISGIDGQAIF